MRLVIGFIGLVLIKTFLCSSSYMSVIINRSHFFDYIKIFPGDPEDCFHVILDLQSQYTWLSVFNKAPYPSKSMTIINPSRDFYYKDIICPVKEIQDFISIDNNKDKVISNFPLFILHNSLYSPLTRTGDGGLGLAFSFVDNRYSLIHQLKKNHYINESSFSIVNRTTLFIGGIPLNNTKEKYHSSCDVIPNGVYWKCSIGDIILSKDEQIYRYENKPNSTIMFTTENHFNFVPKDFFAFLMNDFYKKEIALKKYNLTTYMNYTQLYDIDEGTKHQGSISFNIGNYTYKIDIEVFWFCNLWFCDLDLYENPYGDYWIMGNAFYSKYEVMFDYEERLVHFYSTEGVQKINQYKTSNSSSQKSLIFALITLGIIGIVYTTIIKLSQKS